MRIYLTKKSFPDDIINETQNNKNACGGGAIVSTLSAVKEMGADNGKLLEYTTSYDIRPYGKPTDAVGYAGIVY
jgi:AmmeMemoRadiSam system protein B